MDMLFLGLLTGTDSRSCFVWTITPVLRTHHTCPTHHICPTHIHNVLTCTHTYTLIHVCILALMHAFMHTHTCTHNAKQHTHTHTHTHTQSALKSWGYWFRTMGCSCVALSHRRQFPSWQPRSATGTMQCGLLPSMPWLSYTGTWERGYSSSLLRWEG